MDTGLILTVCLGSFFAGLIMGAGVMRSHYEKVIAARTKYWKSVPPRGRDVER